MNNRENKTEDHIAKDTKICIKMENLRKELYKKYPAHHYAHVQIFSTFWGLYDLLEKNGGLTNE